MAAAQDNSEPGETTEAPAAKPAQPTVEADAAIVVTGSRITRPGFTAPTPVSTVTSEDFEDRGGANIASILNELPSFRASVTPAQTGLLSTVNGTNQLDLRGLGPKRTLVLVNGRRHVPSTPTDSAVDINALPLTAIKRVEVVTGGASAAWGSDAVAGVVNVIYDMDLDGIRFDVQGGLSGQGDAEDFRASFAIGDDFAGERGHFLIAAEYNKNEGILNQTKRDWSAKRWGVIPNPDDTGPNDGVPAQITASNVNLAATTFGGLILTPPLFLMQFGANGSLSPLDFGTLFSFPFQVGGSGANFSDYVTLSVPFERKSLLGAFTYDLTDGIRLTFEGSFSDVHSRNATVYPFDIAEMNILFADNAFLPPAVQTALNDAGMPILALGRINRDFPPITADTRSQSLRYLFALDGTFGDVWEWDVYYQHGRTNYSNKQLNNLNKERYVNALDAVLSGGQIVCRSGAPGCVPLNILGEGSPSAAAIAYVTGTETFDSNRKQDVISGSLQGELIQLPAGPLTVAFGAEYRNESVNSEADDVAENDGWLILNEKATDGGFDVKEAFVEAAVPILKDVAGFHSLDINGAIRIIDYSTIGSATAWKVGANWSPVDWLRFRGTYSQDIRAPHVGELHSPVGLSFDSPRDPCDASRQGEDPNFAANCLAQGMGPGFDAGIGSLVQVFGGGNPNLKEEKARTKTFGAVLNQPVPGLRASIDYFDLNLKGAITALGSQTLLDSCYGSDSLSSPACAAITRGANNRISAIDAVLLNLAKSRIRGIDWEVEYALAGPFHGDDRLRLRWVGTRMLEMSTDDGSGAPALDILGGLGHDNSGLPKWRSNLSANLDVNKWSLFAQVRYIGPGKYNVSYGPEDIDDNSVPSRWYLDTSTSYEVRKGITLFGGVNNVFDKDPPIVVAPGPVPFATNHGLYDIVGRYFYAGIRGKF